MLSAYNLGRFDAENKLQHTLNLMTIAHRRLYDQLNFVDRYDPLTDSPTTVKLNLVQLEKLIVFLRKKHPTKARILQRYIKSQMGGNGSKSKRQLRQSLSS